ncbi:hypothetical protein CK203_029498 [Vitis vinifera]|uniref:Uncharacterized protein n=1 Tax=Vitis vinifera TaxID=29760 RepID=A0A438JCN0_VITVI|nr:hypothetical protein CK203_029498 [Vitis vinifera]
MCNEESEIAQIHAICESREHTAHECPTIPIIKEILMNNYCDWNGKCNEEVEGQLLSNESGTMSSASLMHKNHSEKELREAEQEKKNESEKQEVVPDKPNSSNKMKENEESKEQGKVD